MRSGPSCWSAALPYGRGCRTKIDKPPCKGVGSLRDLIKPIRFLAHRRGGLQRKVQIEELVSPFPQNARQQCPPALVLDRKRCHHSADVLGQEVHQYRLREALPPRRPPLASPEVC